MNTLCGCQWTLWGNFISSGKKTILRKKRSMKEASEHFIYDISTDASAEWIGDRSDLTPNMSWIFLKFKFVVFARKFPLKTQSRLMSWYESCRWVKVVKWWRKKWNKSATMLKHIFFYLFSILNNSHFLPVPFVFLKQASVEVFCFCLVFNESFHCWALYPMRWSRELSWMVLSSFITLWKCCQRWSLSSLFERQIFAGSVKGVNVN